MPLPTQSLIWVNPMGPITLSFGKKCYNVTTPGDNLQISSTKRAYVECMFSPHRLRSLHQGYFPDLIDCRPVFMSKKFVLSRVHVPPARSAQHDAVRCAVWRKQTSARSRARFQKRSACDRLRSDPVILIGRSHSTNADHDRLIRSRKYETKQFIANWIMT